MDYIQSYILNLAPVNTLEELVEHMADDYTPGNIERFFMTCELDTPGKAEGWTAPKWATVGSVCFFMQSVTTKARLRKLQKEVQRLGANMFKLKKVPHEDIAFYYKMLHGLSEAEITSRAFGGSIFAIGKVSSRPVAKKTEANSLQHWKSNICCNYDDVMVLEEPLPFSKFKEYVYFSKQSSITPVVGGAFDKIKQLILKSNKKTSGFFKDLVCSPIPLTKINGSNWLNVSHKYKYQFILEAQFRRYYTDYLLKKIADDGRLYSECHSIKGAYKGFIDNIIKIGDKFLPVEIKLNVASEPYLYEQLQKYYRASEIELNDSMTIRRKDCYSAVLVIDTKNVYVFRRGELIELAALSTIKSSNDIVKLKLMIQECL